MVPGTFRLCILTFRRALRIGTPAFLVACLGLTFAWSLLSTEVCAAPQSNPEAKNTPRKRRSAPRKLAPRKIAKTPRHISTTRRLGVAPSKKRKLLRRTTTRSSTRRVAPKYFDGASPARRATIETSSSRISTRKRALPIKRPDASTRSIPRKTGTNRLTRSTRQTRRTIVSPRTVNIAQPRRKKRHRASQSTLVPVARTRNVRQHAGTQGRTKIDFVETARVTKRPIAKKPVTIERQKPRPIRASRPLRSYRKKRQNQSLQTVADRPATGALKSQHQTLTRQPAPQTLTIVPTATGAGRAALNTLGSAVNKDGWRAEVLGEEPTGIYWDRQTLHTRTSILFSLRLHNAQNASRSAGVVWRIFDLDGRELWRREGRFVVGAGRLLHRRELFEAPARGAYFLRVEVRSNAASSKRERDVIVELPFALSMAPTTGFRPRSFFGLNAPAILSRGELGLYSRIGARVLRSAWQPTNAGESLALDAELRARLERNLATVGVLHLKAPARPLGPGVTVAAIAASGETARSPDELNWSRQVLAPMARWPLISRWEIGGFSSQQRRADLGQALQSLRIAPHTVAFDFSGDGPANTNLSIPGAGFALTDRWLNAWPTLTGTSEAALHPITAQRLLARRKDSAQRPWHLVDISNDKRAVVQKRDEKAQAGLWVTRYLTSVMTGAASFSASLDDNDGSPAQSTLKRTSPESNRAASSNGLQRYARGAAFSTMTRLLEDTAFEGDVFTSSPLLWGALFQGRGENVLAIWTAPHQDGQSTRGHLRLRFSTDAGAVATPVRVLDLFGNEQSQTTGRELSIAVGPEPVYIATARPVEGMRALNREATLTQITPVAVQLLPLSQGFPTPLQVVRVRVQNLVPQSLTGQVQMVPPIGWKLRTDTLPLRLDAGQTRILTFNATQASVATNGDYPFEIVVRSTAGSVRRRQTLQVASAANWRAGQSVQVDGKLAEWRDAVWLSGRGIEEAPESVSTARSAKPALASARLALRWDATRLYIAAKIIEPRLRARRAGANAYTFWRGCDALQLGFGVRDSANASKYFDKSAGAAHDTDYGFLVCPFSVNANGAIEGRVLRLWSPAVPFGARLDALRWGGVVPGSMCAVRRDERAGVTSYEASIPLSQMRELRPAARALPPEASDEANSAMRLAGFETPIRFGWIAHDDASAPRVWPAPASALPWELGASSFLPVNSVLPTTTATFGWTARGRLVFDATTAHPKTITPRPVATPTAPASTPANPQQPVPLNTTPLPATKISPAIKPTPRPTEPARRFSTPEVLPMPPNILPPAALPPGEQLAPKLPS